ncbi:O-antigen ligase family protein [Iodidimonas sp. SYSU 1G8]|uniref:O-antigen ligase family protein n=1 Tax=Iodidimonas sp. SYSU 1G8 TaxID=3133967 RepID=UPI0031FE7EC7
MDAKVPVWEKAFVVFTLFTACNALVLVLSATSVTAGQDGLDESNPLRFAILLTLYSISGILLVRRHSHELLGILSQNKLLLVALGYVVLSCLWSVEPMVAFRRSMALVMTSVFCFYLALRFPLRDLLKLTGIALALVAIISIIGIFTLPMTAYETGDIRKAGWWRGIVGINTMFGRVMALGLLAIWVLRRTAWRFQAYDAVLLGIFLLCLWKAHAATAIVACMAAFISIVIVWEPRRGGMPVYLRLAVTTMAAIPVLALVLTNTGEVLELLGRDATLTNRVYIWQAAFEYGFNSPILGAGYRSFWIEDYAFQVFFNTFGSENTKLGNGHNGFLDVWLELGLVGLVLVAALFGQMIYRALSYLAMTKDDAGAFFGGLMVFILVYSIAEKVIFEHSEITWMLFTSGLIGMRWQRRPVEAPEPAAAAGPAAQPPRLRQSLEPGE